MHSYEYAIGKDLRPKTSSSVRAPFLPPCKELIISCRQTELEPSQVPKANLFYSSHLIGNNIASVPGEALLFLQDANRVITPGGGRRKSKELTPKHKNLRK